MGITCFHHVLRRVWAERCLAILALISFANESSFAQNVAFIARRDFSGGGGLTGLSVGDFNGDGILDVAVADSFGDSVGILMGNGDGTFRPIVRYRVGSSPRFVAVGDFDNDGNLDIVTANSSDISILLGSGDGTFRTGGTFPAGVSPVAVAVGDFNGDGKADIVVVNSFFASSTVTVLLGKGDGTFQSPRSFPVGNNPSWIVAADLNGDGRLDVAVANSGSNNVSVMLGNGDGTFQPARNFATGMNPRSLCVGDFNGDGRPDLITADANSNDLSLLLGNGDGTFQVPRSLPLGTSPSVIIAGDLNGDGQLDLALVVAPQFSSAFSVRTILGNGDGTFRSPRNFPLGNTPTALGFGDFNRDGRLDLVVSESGGFQVGMLEELLGNGDGSFEVSTDLSAGNSPVSLALGDFNRDGNPDVAVLNSFAGEVDILLSNGDGTLTRGADISLPGFGTGRILAGDFNGDGNLDLLVVYSQPTNNLVVILGNGDGTFRIPLTLSVGFTPNGVALGDFNGDGSLDVALTDSNSNAVWIVLGTGDGSFQLPQAFPAGSNPTALAVGDFNGDGLLDLAVTNPVSQPGASGNVSVLLGNGDGTFQSEISYPVERNPVFIVAADLNGDGAADLVVANRDSKNVTVLLNNGDGTFQAGLNAATNSNPSAIVVADFNGDGLPDLAVVNSVSNSVSILLNRGSQFGPGIESLIFFVSAGEFGTGKGPADLVAADFNNDGRADLLVLNRESNNLSLLINNTPVP